MEGVLLFCLVFVFCGLAWRGSMPLRRGMFSTDGMQRTHLAVHDFETVTVTTKTVGELVLRTIGPDDGSNQLVVAIHGASHRLVDEWDRMASALAAAGRRVVLPDFHSNSETAPSKASPQLIAEVLDELLRHHLLRGRQRFALMGKSWGGAAASEYAQRHPTTLDALVLAAPANARDPKALQAVAKHGFPVLLLWAEDDGVVPLAAAKAAMQDAPGNLVLETVAEGGHAVVAEYTPMVAEFLGQEPADPRLGMGKEGRRRG